MSPKRSLREICTSGARVGAKELFKALTDAGCAVEPTKKPTHFWVRRASRSTLIATRKPDLDPKYLSKIAKDLGFRDEWD